MPCQSICILNHRSDILVGMLKKEKKRTADLEMSVKQGGGRIPDGTAVAPEGIRRSTSQPLSDDSESELSNLRSASRTRVKDRPSSDTTEVYTNNSCVKIFFFFFAQSQLSNVRLVQSLPSLCYPTLCTERERAITGLTFNYLQPPLTCIFVFS